jgi:hypothetical protein
MENRRKKPTHPVRNESNTHGKPDDFEPDVTGMGAKTVNDPVPPPCDSFDCGVVPPAAPGA